MTIHAQRRPSLRPYQEEAVRAIADGLANGGSGQLYAACGSGKTLIAMRAAERVVGPTALVVVLAPSLALVAQTLQGWRNNSTIDFSFFAVCSDDSVVPDDESAAQVAEIGVTVSTQREDIAKMLTVEGPRLIASTYSSADRLAECVRDADLKIDFLACDEAHHLAGDAESPTRLVVDQAVLPAHRRLFMTATPRIGVSRKGDPAGQTLSMDDHVHFGPVFYNYPFSRAIAEGYLEDYRIAVIGVTTKEAQEVLSRDDIEYAEGVGMRAAASQVALARAYQDFGMRRVISFHPTVAEAQKFTDTLPLTLRSLPGSSRVTVPVPTCLHANGAMPGDVRRRVLEDLANPPVGDWAVASNARCLSEGVDVPAVDGVLFTHPKRSTIDIVQATGRALRRHPDTPGPSTVIVPVILPDETSPSSAFDAGPYETLITIVRALRDHDDALAAELDRLSKRLGAKDTEGIEDPEPLQKITALMPHGVPADALAAIRLLVVERTTSSWWAMYGAARDFHAEHRHLKVPRGSTSASGVRLDTWLATQRQKAQQPGFPAERRQALEALGMTWPITSLPEQQRLIDAARTFHAAHGHLLVPRSYREPERNNYDLAKTLMEHYDRRVSGKSMPDELDAALNELGIVWEYYEPSEHRWQVTYQAAAAYRDAFGDLRVPSRYSPPGPYEHLGQWLEGHRQDEQQVGNWRAYGHGVTAAHRSALDQIDMIWDARQDERYVALEVWYSEWGKKGKRTRGCSYSLGFPSDAEYWTFTGSLTALVNHAEAEHGPCIASHPMLGSAVRDAARLAGETCDIHLDCAETGCAFTTDSVVRASGLRRCQAHCPRCTVAVVDPGDTWYLGASVQSLYECPRCGHIWTVTRTNATEVPS